MRQVRFVAVKERVNNRRDLAKLIEQIRDGSTEEIHISWLRNPPEATRKKPEITPRQLEMIRLKSQGLSTREIAERMGITTTYVYASLKRICTKLDVKSADEAMSAREGDSEVARPLDKPRLPTGEEKSQPEGAARKTVSRPIAPLTPEHIRLLELLSTGLTIYEVAVLLEVEPNDAVILRRQAYLRLGVTSLKDAIAVSGVEVPQEKPFRPKPVRRPNGLSKDDRRKKTQEILSSVFGPAAASRDDAYSSPVGDCWPDYLWLLHYPSRETYLCIRREGVTGMICFSSKDIAEAFLEAISDKPAYAEGCMPVEAPFDSARDIAIARPEVQALILLDNPDEMHFHYVC